MNFFRVDSEKKDNEYNTYAYVLAFNFVEALGASSAVVAKRPRTDKKLRVNLGAKSEIKKIARVLFRTMR